MALYLVVLYPLPVSCCIVLELPPPTKEPRIFVPAKSANIIFPKPPIIVLLYIAVPGSPIAPSQI